MEQAWLDELSELLRIPSVSADPVHAPHVREAAEWVAEFVRRAGGNAEVEPGDTHPLVVGEIRASNGNGDAPTILVYGHFDVQPPAPLELWESEPFEATVRGEWLYARGVADDKGQLWTLLKGAELLAAEGRLPVNLRFACDGEEEVGGHAIVDFLERDERGADACIIFDSSMERRGVPAVCTATRGVMSFNLVVRTRRTRSPLGHVRQRGAERDARTGVGARRDPPPRRAVARRAARRRGGADGRGARELERADAGRRRRCARRARYRTTPRPQTTSTFGRPPGLRST